MTLHCLEPLKTIHPSSWYEPYQLKMSCNQVGLKPACSATEASKNPGISDKAPIGITLSRQGIMKTLIRLQGCADWSLSLLLAYGINRFSYDVTHVTEKTVEENLCSETANTQIICQSLWNFYLSEYVRKESKLLMYIGDFSRQLDYLHKLITIIDVHNLTQVWVVLLTFPPCIDPIY